MEEGQVDGQVGGQMCRQMEWVGGKWVGKQINRGVLLQNMHSGALHPSAPTQEDKRRWLETCLYQIPKRTLQQQKADEGQVS